MSKPKSPLLAFRASGAIAHKVIYFHRAGKQLARSYHEYPPIPLIPPIVEEKIMRYVELYPPEKVPDEGDVWWAWDISDLLPPEAIAVDIYIRNAATYTAVVGARENGSTLERLILLTQKHTITLRCNVADAKVIEIYSDARVYTSFRIIGYWTED